MSKSYLFLPVPRRISFGEGVYSLPPSALIHIDAVQPQPLRSAADRLTAALARYTGLTYTFAAGAVPAGRVAVTLRVAPERTPAAQAYRLHVTPSGVVVEGHDPAGVFYGVCTLIQLVEQAGIDLPTVEVQDWPDIPARGVMLDISRDRVYTMETLYELIDRLAGWKLNQVQLYTEHTFAYQNHPQVWENASPMTAAEIMALDEFCRECHIELVPNQNSFGHMERWLIYDRYHDLAETHEEFTTPWGNTMKGPFSLAPEHPGSFPLIQSLYDELLPHFTSKMFNVGCDETIDLGQGVSKEICEQKGKGQVYFDYLLKVYADLKERGYTMQFWGDIINNDHPELAAQLPRDVIALCWGYEAVHPFDVEGARFAASGVPFYVCPGTSTWCSLAGRTDNALGNLLNAAENGIKHGAIGYLNTDWGDRGHWQIPPASYLGFAVGAAYSWALEANRGMDVPGVVSRFAFEDPTGTMGRVAYEVGNLYLAPGIYIPNGSALFWILQRPLEEAKRYLPNGSAPLYQTLEAIDKAIAPLEYARINRPDAELIRREYIFVARLMRHAARRGILAIDGDKDGLRDDLARDMNEILAEYEALWLERSRPGGLSDSKARLANNLADYETFIR